MGGYWYSVGIALFASMGTLLYGFDTGIATTTIAHPSFLTYMHNPNNALTGLVVSIYIAGEAIGSLVQILIADKLGRVRFMQLCSIVVTIGVSIQTGAVNIGMLLAGRFIAGTAIGGLSATIPIYLSEISPPAHRGLIGGMGGVGLSFGTMMSNWIGFAGGYAPYGATQWRLPLGLQIPWGIILFFGLSTFMPNSPRQLIQHGKITEARAEFAKVRRDIHAHEVLEEFEVMRSQIEYEMERQVPTYREIFKLYRHRVLVAIAVQVLTTVTGVNVIQYYQSILYKSLGIQSHAVLALTGAWGTCAFFSNATAVFFLPDRWGRRKMLLAGVACVIVTEIYSAIMQREFQNTDNKVGKGFAILGIYVFAVCYYGLINSVTWLYGAEILPMHIRSRMMGVSAFAHYSVNVAFTEAGPSAFANIHENYYYVFVGCCSIYFVLIYLFFPETKQKNLEEIAAAFGDRVIDVDEKAVEAEQVAMEAKTTTVHLEDTASR